MIINLRVLISSHTKTKIKLIYPMGQTNDSSLSLEKEDITIIAVPSHGGRVPSLAAQRQTVRNCISCMRYVVKCPQSPRKVKGAMVVVAALVLKRRVQQKKKTNYSDYFLKESLQSSKRE